MAIIDRLNSQEALVSSASQDIGNSALLSWWKGCSLYSCDSFRGRTGFCALMRRINEPDDLHPRRVIHYDGRKAKSVNSC